MPMAASACSAGWRTDAQHRRSTSPQRLHAAAEGDLVGGAPRAQAGRSATRRRATLEAVTAAAFGQRRKMIRQSLKSTGVPVEPLLAAAGLKGDERAEDLPVEAFLDDGDECAG